MVIKKKLSEEIQNDVQIHKGVICHLHPDEEQIYPGHLERQIPSICLKGGVKSQVPVYISISWVPHSRTTSESQKRRVPYTCASFSWIFHSQTPGWGQRKVTFTISVPFPWFWSFPHFFISPKKSPEKFYSKSRTSGGV